MSVNARENIALQSKWEHTVGPYYYELQHTIPVMTTASKN
jgi:hypothetical protein